MAKKRNQIDAVLKSNRFVLIDLDNLERQHFNSYRQVAEEVLYKLDQIDGMEIAINYLNSYGGEYRNAKTSKKDGKKDSAAKKKRRSKRQK